MLPFVLQKVTNSLLPNFFKLLGLQNQNFLNSQNLHQNCRYLFLSSHISFLVFGHFWRRSYENTKILHNLCLHFARQDGQDGKKRKENHTTKVTKIPKSKRQKYDERNKNQNFLNGQNLHQNCRFSGYWYSWFIIFPYSLYLRDDHLAKCISLLFPVESYVIASTFAAITNRSSTWYIDKLFLMAGCLPS